MTAIHHDLQMMEAALASKKCLCPVCFQETEVDVVTEPTTAGTYWGPGPGGKYCWWMACSERCDSKMLYMEELLEDDVWCRLAHMPKIEELDDEEINEALEQVPAEEESSVAPKRSKFIDPECEETQEDEEMEDGKPHAQREP